jgi:hypothetical protein
MIMRFLRRRVAEMTLCVKHQHVGLAASERFPLVRGRHSAPTAALDRARVAHLIEDEFGVACHPSHVCHSETIKRRFAVSGVRQDDLVYACLGAAKMGVKVQRLDLHRSPGNIPHK